MNRVIRSARILWRAESMLGSLRLAGMLKKAGLFAVAALVGVFGIVMLDLAAFFALAPEWGQSGAALIVAAGDFLLAGVIVFISQRVGPGAETQMLTEVRDMALEDLEAEAAGLETAWVHARREFLDRVRHPLATLAPGVLMPLLKSLLAGLRANKPEA